MNQACNVRDGLSIHILLNLRQYFEKKIIKNTGRIHTKILTLCPIFRTRKYGLSEMAFICAQWIPKSRINFSCDFIDLWWNRWIFQSDDAIYLCIFPGFIHFFFQCMHGTFLNVFFSPSFIVFQIQYLPIQNRLSWMLQTKTINLSGRFFVLFCNLIDKCAREKKLRAWLPMHITEWFFQTLYYSFKSRFHRSNAVAEKRIHNGETTGGNVKKNANGIFLSSFNNREFLLHYYCYLLI